MPPPFAMALEAGLNRYLALDVDAGFRMSQLQGCIVKLLVTGTGMGVYFLFHDDRVELLEEFAGSADAIVSAAPLSLIAVASGRRGIHDADIELSGDIDIAQRFSRLFQQLDVDWEEHVSKLTGDSAAHQLGRFVRGAHHWVTRTGNAMRSNTADYLRDESNHLPHDWEIDEFSNAVDDVRDRVDRLAEKVRTYKEQAEAGRRVDATATSKTKAGKS